jgi:hypothetical protein
MAAKAWTPSGPDDAEVAPSRPRMGRQSELLIRFKAGEAQVTLVFRINFLRFDLKVPIFGWWKLSPLLYSRKPRQLF